MKKIKYILTESELIRILICSRSLNEFMKESKICLSRKSEKIRFNNYYNIDIMDIINNNHKIYSLIKKLDFENEIVKCDNCGKYYRNGSRIRENKSGRHFCSDFCSKRFSSSFSHSVEKNKKLSDKMKHLFKIGKIKTPNGDYKELSKIRNEYDKSPKICPICKKEIPFKNRFHKTCSNDCGKKLLGISVHNTQLERHSAGGLRKGSGRGKKGWYKGYYCDSTWELFWVIYNLDHNINFKRNTSISFDYIFDGKKRKYYPDFIMEDNSFVEIKGYVSEQWKEKIKSVPKNFKIKVLYRKDISPFKKYVIEKYGSDINSLYDNSNPVNDIKNKKFVWMHKDGKNTIINPSEFDEYKSNGWIRGRI